MDVPGLRLADSRAARLFHRLDRTHPDRGNAQRRGQAGCVHQLVPASRCAGVPSRTRQRQVPRVQLPRLGLRQRRALHRHQGHEGRRLQRGLRSRRASPGEGAALCRVSRHPVRQPQPRGARARNAPGRCTLLSGSGDRPEPAGRGTRARMLDLHVQRQLETADRELRRRLPSQFGAPELHAHRRATQVGRVGEQSESARFQPVPLARGDPRQLHVRAWPLRAVVEEPDPAGAAAVRIGR